MISKAFQNIVTQMADVFPKKFGIVDSHGLVLANNGGEPTGDIIENLVYAATNNDKLLLRTDIQFVQCQINRMPNMLYMLKALMKYQSIVVIPLLLQQIMYVIIMMKNMTRTILCKISFSIIFFLLIYTKKQENFMLI